MACGCKQICCHFYTQINNQITKEYQSSEIKNNVNKNINIRPSQLNLPYWSGFCWRCLSPCWTARASCSHIGDKCKWSSIPRVRGELAEDKGTSFGLQRGYAINHQGSGPGRHGSRGVCLPWLSYPLIIRKHLWHQPPKCHHSCCHAELRESDLEVTARQLNKVEAVQHVYLTNIPIHWFGLLGDI